MNNKYSVIIPAAGSSNRFGKEDKLLVKINNVHLIKHTLDIFLEDDDCAQVILVTSNKNTTTFKNFFHLNKKFLLVVGDDTRFKSVRNGFKYVHKNIENVLIHDGCRPFLSSELLQTIKTELIENNHQAVIPLLDIYDSMVLLGETIEYKNRDLHKLVQTPQGFKKSLLDTLFTKEITKQYNDTFSFVLDNQQDIDFKIVQGERQNIKVTHKDDLWFFKYIGGNQDD